MCVPVSIGENEGVIRYALHKISHIFLHYGRQEL